MDLIRQICYRTRPTLSQVEILRFLKGEHQVQLSTVKILTQYNSQRHLLETKLHKVCEDRGQNVFDRYDKNKLKISTVVSSQGKASRY